MRAKKEKPASAEKASVGKEKTEGEKKLRNKVYFKNYMTIIKSEFSLALNQVATERGISPDDVIFRSNKL